MTRANEQQQHCTLIVCPLVLLIEEPSRSRRDAVFESKMETSISRMYSEFTGHFAGAYQRILQFYLWCMSRAGIQLDAKVSR